MSVIRVSRRASERVRGGHLWVYRSDVEGMEASGEAAGSGGAGAAAGSGGAGASAGAVGAGPGAGEVVTVVDGRGRALGSGIYSTASQIAVRMVSAKAELGRAEYVAEVGERLRGALRLRRELAPVTERDNAHRLVFSEADGLPGIVADRYNDLVVLQLLTQGTAQDDVRAAVVEGLRAEFGEGPLTVWERPDPRMRELEELAAPADGPLYASGAAEATTEFLLNGLRFGYDVGAGQKTGAFLDQRLNYAAAAAVVGSSGRRERALDVCTYQGGFGLHLAQVCERVTGVDASRAALEAADRNLARNPGLGGEVDWIEADAFELLRAFEETARRNEAERWDAVVLDPPAFAKSKRATEGALRGYKELNLRALRMLKAGGTLVTCSCSHHVGLEEFTAVLASAAADAGRRVQLLATRGAAPDHPEVLTLAETRYLKCLIARVD